METLTVSGNWSRELGRVGTHRNDQKARIGGQCPPHEEPRVTEREDQDIRKTLIGLVISGIMFMGAIPNCIAQSPSVDNVFSYRVTNTFPHDPSAFTQGLVIDGGVMYEGTGLRGQSSLRRVDLESGQVSDIRLLSSQYFGEGITVFDERIIQLTWQSNIGFVYDKHTFDLLDDFEYPTEGWGITHDGEHLIMSDGTSTLHFLDPTSFEEVRSVAVQDDNGPVVRLNELEYIGGYVYANVWLTDRIARIQPHTGYVDGWIDFAGLLTPEERRRANVLNGIAYDADMHRLFVTGKLWPKLFEVVIVPEPASLLVMILPAAIVLAARPRHHLSDKNIQSGVAQCEK